MADVDSEWRPHRHHENRGPPDPLWRQQQEMVAVRELLARERRIVSWERARNEQLLVVLADSRRRSAECACVARRCPWYDSVIASAAAKATAAAAPLPPRRWHGERTYESQRRAEFADEVEIPQPSSLRASWSPAEAPFNESIEAPVLTLEPVGSSEGDPQLRPSVAPPKAQEAGHVSFLSGSMFVAIVVLTVLPAAIVIGVFWLWRRRR